MTSARFTRFTTALLQTIYMESCQQFRRPFVWFCFVCYFAIAFGDTVQSGWTASGNIWINGADMIVRRAIIYSILGSLAVAGIMAESMSRDRQAGAVEMILSTGIGRCELALGRFVVSFFTAALTAAMFVPGVILGSMMAGIPQEQIGPFVGSHYLQAFTIIVLPNYFVVAALVFAVSARRQRQTAAYLAVVGFLAIWILTRMLLGQDILRHEVFQVYAMLDPYASIASAEFTRGWTILQKNTEFPPFAGLIVINRMIWCGIGSIFIALGVWSLPIYVNANRNRSWKRRRASRARPEVSDIVSSLPRTIGPPSFGRQVQQMFCWELRCVSRTPGLRLLLLIAAFSLWWSAASAVTHQFSLPSTDLLLHNTGFYFDKALLAVIVITATDIIWREQSHHVSELVESLPTSDTARLTSKTLVLMFVVFVFWLIAIGVNLIYQLAKGYYQFELPLYFVDVFLFKAPYYLWFAVIAIGANVILRQRYVAMCIVLLIFASEIMLDAIGFYHPIYRFGRVSFFWYSLMDGYGHFGRAHAWLVLYWSLGTAIVWMIALGCYARGLYPPSRLTLLRGAIRRPKFLLSLSGLIAAFICVGIQVWAQSTWNAPWPPVNPDQHMAKIEKQFAAKWRGVPQPKLVSIQGELDLYPSQRRWHFRGTQTLENQSQRNIDRLLVLAEPGLVVENLALSSDATIESVTPELNATEFRLAKELRPNEQIQLEFVTSHAPPEGFSVHAKNDGTPEVLPVELIGNGSSLLNLQLMPAVGYSDRIEHKPRWKRRKYGLREAWRPPPFEAGKNEAHSTAHLGWVDNVDMTIRTDADQTVLHAGKLVRRWTEENGRQAFHFVMDKRNRGWSVILTGRYVEQRFQRDDLPEVTMVYDPRHTFVINEFGHQLHAAMAHFVSRYGPAPFDTFQMAEQSLHYDGMGARSGLAFATEILGWKSDLSVSRGQDLAQMSAHLMGMSWFGDQIIPANTPGAKILHAGLPYWSAALYLHQQREPEVDRRLRLQDTMELFRSRSSMADEEAAFSEEIKDSTILRRKGAILMVYLASLIGVENLESIFAEFLETWRHRSAPYPTSRDFLEHLKNSVDENFHAQIADIFERVTTWRLEVIAANCEPTSDGRWKLTAEIDAAKFITSGEGLETEVPLDTPVWLHAFRGHGFAEDDLIESRLKSLKSGRSTVEWFLDHKPTRFGVDSYLMLPDRNPHNNVLPISGTSDGN